MWEDQPNLVFSSANAVMQIGSKTATMPLLKILCECPFPGNREAAAMVFKYVRDDRAIPTLQWTLANKNEAPAVRFQAADALAAWEPESSLDAFLDASVDEEPEVRWIASYGLAACGGDRAVAALNRLANDDAAPAGMETVGAHALELLESLDRDGKRAAPAGTHEGGRQSQKRRSNGQGRKRT
jgi:HEAT repeat protein